MRADSHEALVRDSVISTNHLMHWSILILGCSRDIAFLIDTSTRSHFSSHFASSQSAALTAKLQLVHDVASQIDIGPYDSLISLTTFDQSVHKQWDFDQYMNKNDLLKAISQVHSHLRYSPHGDIEEALKYLISHVLDDDHGDRDHFADDVIIITDASSSFHSALFERSLQHKSRDVIIISVGTHAPSSGGVGDLATDPAHIIHVSNYSQLSSIGGKLFNLLCS